MIGASVMNINLGDMLDVFMNSRRMKLWEEVEALSKVYQGNK